MHINEMPWDVRVKAELAKLPPGLSNQDAADQLNKLDVVGVPFWRSVGAPTPFNDSDIHRVLVVDELVAVLKEKIKSHTGTDSEIADAVNAETTPNPRLTPGGQPLTISWISSIGARDLTPDDVASLRVT